LSALLAPAMRILVTGAANPVGAAVCEALARAGHTVRAFGIPAGEDPFHGAANIECYPGDVVAGGSIEPVAAECQALVHAANLDAPTGDRVADAVHVEAGTRYARYAAERELVGHFIALFPAAIPRGLGPAVHQAEAHVKATRRLVPHFLLYVVTPEEAVRQVLGILAKVPVAAAPA
jgi:nucleoside-diphosphate-sugar epimerase